MLITYPPAKEKDLTHVSITYQNHVLANVIVIKSLKIYALHKLATFNAVLLRYYVNRSDFIYGSRVLKTQILNSRHSKNDTYSCRVPKI